MATLPYLNLGCGGKIHPDWVNVDMAPRMAGVQACDLRRGIPFPDDTFEVVYHSQVLEHIPPEEAPFFIQECLRVLRPGGRIRVVVPDLESIMEAYRTWLHRNLAEPDPVSEANYDFILLELFDQMVRTKSGGRLGELLDRPHLVNEEFILDRCGHVAHYHRACVRRAMEPPPPPSAENRPAWYRVWYGTCVRLPGRVLRQILGAPQRCIAWLRERMRSEEARLGAFRMGGEIHQWMYDRFSLGRLLSRCGFVEVERHTPFTSGIPDWSSYALDIREGRACDPGSLFLEARKPDPATPSPDENLVHGGSSMPRDGSLTG